MPQSRNHDGVTVQSVCLYFFHWRGEQILKANMKKASSQGGGCVLQHPPPPPPYCLKSNFSELPQDSVFLPVFCG